jgi:four helix bundle protein
MTSEELADRLINFAARVGKVVDALPDTRMGRHIAGQLVRSGTSPAPNYEEACAAESRADFSHKLSSCLKELRESRCWIRSFQCLIGIFSRQPLSSDLRAASITSCVR